MLIDHDLFSVRLVIHLPFSPRLFVGPTLHSSGKSPFLFLFVIFPLLSLPCAFLVYCAFLSFCGVYLVSAE
ncbi:hypothetical protein BDW67DRAFT_22448 [Aspergillus spinulosporus]